MVRGLYCLHCKARLQNRGARCRECGWARIYEPVTRRREVVLGVGMVVVSAVMAIVFTAIVVELIIRPNL
jgi:DNA-directed RNA polymerase subunit RPC12/RpoP